MKKWFWLFIICIFSLSQGASRRAVRSFLNVSKQLFLNKMESIKKFSAQHHRVIIGSAVVSSPLLGLGYGAHVVNKSDSEVLDSLQKLFGPLTPEEEAMLTFKSRSTSTHKKLYLLLARGKEGYAKAMWIESVKQFVEQDPLKGFG